MPKLKLQYFGHLMQRANWLEKTLTLEKIEGKRKGDREDEKKKKKDYVYKLFFLILISRYVSPTIYAII